MPKETFYFSHDYNARNDEKIKRLLRKHSFQGYGIYWAIIEELYQNANALQLDCEGIAFDLRADESIVESVIKDFGLFEFEDDTFGSLSVQRRLDERDERSKKARASARKRWDGSERNANVMQTHSEGNAIKERKGKENNEKNTIPEYSEFLEHALEKCETTNSVLDEDKCRLRYEAWKDAEWCKTKDGKLIPIKNWKSTLTNTLPYISKKKPQGMTIERVMELSGLNSDGTPKL